MVRYHVERPRAIIGTSGAVMPTTFTGLSILSMDPLPREITHYHFQIDNTLSGSGYE
jgi:hypothetical protein